MIQLNEVESSDSNQLMSNIATKDWECVYEGLFNIDYNTLSIPTKNKCCGTCDASTSLLHYLMKHDPPIEIVEKLVHDFPSDVGILDCMNRSPLQVGLQYGITSPEVVQYLIQTNAFVTKIQDKEGKTLLHLALDGYDNIMDEVNGELSPAYLDAFSEIINIICCANPSMVEIMDDFEQLNAVDYALERDVDFAIIKSLQKVAKKVSMLKLWKI